MNSLLEILSPSFLLRDSLYTSLVIGAVCPIVGVYLLLRKMVFIGVALPQVSAAGIAFALLLVSVLFPGHEHGAHLERVIALAGSIGFTLIALLLLAWFESGSAHLIESKIGATYAFATSLTFLFLAVDPSGEAQMVNILRGDMLAATRGSLLVLTSILLAVAAVFVKFGRQFLLIAFDRQLSSVFQMRIKFWDLLLYICIGLTISIGVIGAGPLVVFGFLVIPPFAARSVTKHMTSFMVLSSMIGLVSAFIGFYSSYVLDFPLAACEVFVVSMVSITLHLYAVAGRWWPKASNPGTFSMESESGR